MLLTLKNPIKSTEMVVFVLLSRLTDEIKTTLYAVFSDETELISRKLQKIQDMRVSRIIAGILAVVVGLSSCVRDVIMDAKEKPKVVVSCILSNDPVQRLNLSMFGARREWRTKSTTRPRLITFW